MKFTKTQDLLLREAAFAARSLGVGLTELRRYNFANKGAFFHASVSIATGLERLLKLIAIYCYRIENNDKFPTNDQMKNGFGHRIPLLIDNARAATRRIGVDASWDVIDEALSKKIIGLLSDFATTARYYNLDVLTGKRPEVEEPLTRWERAIGEEIVRRHPKQIFNREHFDEFCRLFDQSASFMHVGDGGEQIGDAKSFFLASEQIEPKQKYSMFYSYRILRVFAHLIRDLEYHGEFYPYCHEFFRWFRVDDDKLVLRTKVWTKE